MIPFNLPRIKICGITLPEDAVLAYTAGADAVGVVFHPPSPRSVSLEDARRIVQELPFGFPVIAVMVDPDPEAAAAWCREAGVSALQLCGGEALDGFAGFPMPLLRRIGVEAGAQDQQGAWSGLAVASVLDHPAAPGGTGRAVDWTRAAALAALGPCLLAGGLGPDNVGAAVAAVRPRGVDASSRLESSPGRKDPGAVRAFVAAAVTAFRRPTP